MTSDSALYPQRHTISAPKPAAEPAIGHTAALWFTTALAVMFASQIGKILAGADQIVWLALDYGWRIAALGVLALGPLRALAFCQGRDAVSWKESLLWIIGLVLVERWPLGAFLRFYVFQSLPAFSFYSATPVLDVGILRLFDLTVGIALVAVSEEILFRRCARWIIERYVGDGVAMIVISALLFGAIHWATGLPNIASATLAGAYAMIAYKRIGAIWPLMIGHYLCDVIAAS